MPSKESRQESRHYRAELRFAPGADWPLSGHIAKFNVLSEDFGGWREKIAPGAFADTIARDDIRGLWNHDDNLVLGRTASGTLELEEDSVGLSFRNRPPETSWFKDAAISLKRRDVTGCSFAFFTEADAWSEQGGTQIRTLKKVRLVEVSPGVTFPAYPQTDVALRSREAWMRRGGSRSGSTHGSRERELRLLEMKLLMHGRDYFTPTLSIREEDLHPRLRVFYRELQLMEMKMRMRG